VHSHHRLPTTNTRLTTQTNAMVSFTAMLLLAGAVMQAQAQDFTDLVGTWSSKSNSTFTGDVRKLA
jgi:hypothetical protein